VSVRCAVIPAAGLGTRFLPATKAVPKELLPIGDTPLLQIVIDEALGAGVEHVVVVSSRSKPGIEAYFEDRPEVIAALEAQGRHELAERIRGIGSDWRATIVYQDQPRGLGHAVGCAREAVGDQPFAVLLPDELMGDSSLLAHMNGVCVSSGGSVVALKRVAIEDVGAYGVIDPLSPVDPDGVVAIGGMVEKPDPTEAPSDLIIIGRYVLTPDVFDEIATLKPGAIGEIQLTDALRIQAARSPFHGVLSDVERFDTGTPIGYLKAAISITMRRPDIGVELSEFVGSLSAGRETSPAGL
jgi:UTP--glucose-1-phosphate uridylyltransferase